MTQDQDNKLEVITPFEERAIALLTVSERDDMNKYIKEGGAELALSTANKFFELYINGNDVEEIHRLNTAFPRSIINWSRIKYNWDAMRQEYIIKLQNKIVDKVMKAQLEATSLYADVISAANKRHSDSLKKYIQTGDEQYLVGGLNINSIAQLSKAVEGLQKVTGQDKNIKITKEDRTSVDININSSLTTGDGISTESAAKILSVLAEERRLKENK